MGRFRAAAGAEPTVTQAVAAATREGAYAALAAALSEQRDQLELLADEDGFLWDELVTAGLRRHLEAKADLAQTVASLQAYEAALAAWPLDPRD
jgi:hypothetical protein